MDATATSVTARVDISAAAVAAAELAAPSLAAPSKEAGCDVAVAALRFPREEAGGCFPFFLGKLPSVPTATVPEFARVVRMMVRRALGRNEGGYWMIFVGKVMLWGGIMMKFAENGVGGSFQSTGFYVGTGEQNNSLTIKFKGNSRNGITPQVTGNY
jgi:hypothetical protein